MQRILTIIALIILFAVGVYGLAGGFGVSGGAYEPPSDPGLAAALVGAMAGIVVLIIAAGGGLSFAFKQLGGILEKEKPGAPSGPKAEPGSAAPYTPAYSFKAAPESAEIRQWAIGAVVILALLAGYSALGNASKWAKMAQQMDRTQWAIFGGGAAAIIVLILLVGAGLAFWFYRTSEEQSKTLKK